MSARHNSEPPAPARRPRRRARVLRVLEPLLVLVFLLAGLAWGLRRLSGADGRLAVAEDELALVRNGFTGRVRAVDGPRNELFLPFVEVAHVLRRSSRSLVLTGEKDGGAGEYERALVRTSEGASFYLDRLEIEYGLRPGEGEAWELLDQGLGQRGRADALVAAHARAVVSEVFGAYAADEVVRTESLQAAASACQARLDAALEPFGLGVLQVSIPKPRFEKHYETALQRRNVYLKEIDRLEGLLGQLDEQRAERVAHLRIEKEQELRALERKLAEHRAASQRENITVSAEAERYYAQRVAAGEDEKAETEQQALALRSRIEAEVAGLRARAEALEQRGELAVREALIERLAEVRFRIVPYAADPAPREVKLGALAGGEL